MEGDRTMETRVNFVQEMSIMSDRKGPCRWNISDWMDKKRPVYVAGVCRTEREAQGLTTRVAKALDRAYRLGVKHGKHPTPNAGAVPRRNDVVTSPLLEVF